MTRIKHRVSYGAMAGGVLFATVLAPAQAVLAATGADTAPPSATSGTPGTSQTAPAGTSPTGSPSGSTGNTAVPSASPTPAPTSGQGSSAATPQSAGANKTSVVPNGNPTAASSNTPTQNGNTQPGQNGPAANGSNTAANTQNNTGQTATVSTISQANTGNVKAQGNLSSVGNAASGNAKTVDTQVTTLNSTNSLTQAGGLQTFTFDINGNHAGDIVLSPGDFLQSSAATVVQGSENANVTTQTDSTITNTIDLSSISGDVTVQGNLGNVGNATSGDAATEVNLINMIESTVSDKQSFVGMVNINGNLKGNLLLPKTAIDQLLPASPAGSSKTTTNATNTTTTTNNLAVDNNVTLDATSGNIDVQGNVGSSGNATSGNGTTGIKLYNLTNSKIVGGNVLLVFVNVEGSWAGLLMNAPAGTTSAALGGGITQDTALQNTATTSTNETITNNVNLSSQSGNVKVQGNGGKTGNTKTGNATANADIVNIMGSQIDLSGWLGVMVINVYGGWQGSLLIQPTGTTIHVKAPAVHRTVNHASPISYPNTGGSASTGQSLNDTKPVADHLLGTTTNNPANILPNKGMKNDSAHKSGFLSAATLAAFGAILAATGGATQFITHRRK